MVLACGSFGVVRTATHGALQSSCGAYECPGSTDFGQRSVPAWADRFGRALNMRAECVSNALARLDAKWHIRNAGERAIKVQLKPLKSLLTP